MILVDSSVWVAYFNGKLNWQTDFLDHLLHEEPLLLGDLIMTEVLQGFRLEKDFLLARELLNALEFVQIGGYTIALAAATNYRAMRKQGITIRKTINVLIGSFCIENNLSLLHNDRDFDPMENLLGLRVVSCE